MKILSKYILREHILPFLGGLIIILFVLVMDFILDIFNLIIAKGVNPIIVGKLFVFNLAWMFALAVPMACLIASLMAFGRLAGDGEISACASSGISLHRLMLLPSACALMLSFAMIYFSDQILPDSNYEAKNLLSEIKRQKPSLAIRERVFMDDFPGAGLYVEDVNEKTNELWGITIYDQEKRRVPRIITAQYGTMEYSEKDDAITFELKKGYIHEIDEKDPRKYTRVHFERQTIRFTELGYKSDYQSTGHRGDRELSIDAMKARIASKDSAIAIVLEEVARISNDTYRRAFKPSGSGEKDIIRRLDVIRRRVKSTLQAIESQLNTVEAHRRYNRKYLVEINKKITLPFACLFFFLVGAPVGVWSRKGGLGFSLAVGLGFFVIYWAFLIGGEDLADRGFIAPWLGMWMPNIVMLIITVFMMYRTIFSSRFKTVDTIARIYEKAKRIFHRNNPHHS